MNKYFKIIFSLSLVVTLFSCAKDDNNSVEKPRDYTEQYAKDIDSIDKFIDTHSMTVDADYNVSFTEITAETPGTPIRNNPNLEFKTVTNETHGVDYKIYFIKLREGDGEHPTSVDSVHVSYRGVETIKGEQFDFAQNPVWFKPEEIVPGWSEIMPYFATGTYDPTDGPDPVAFNGYGAGVMFLPSGMGYFNLSRGTLAAYSNLVFSFKLYALRYRDHDGDGILSKDEVPLGSDFLYDPRKYNSDKDVVGSGDEIPNYFDVDDDGDRVLTKNELKKPDGTFHTFETVPDCNGLATDPDRVRRYLDPNCKPPFTN
jgi:FKBP-type peptidyl-prolyl cis-trans isomerase FkpA